MEIVKYEYHVSYLQKPIEPIEKPVEPRATWYWQISTDFSVGSIVTAPTDLRGTNLVSWLHEIIAETVDAKKEEIVIIAISKIGSFVYEID